MSSNSSSGLPPVLSKTKYLISIALLGSIFNTAFAQPDAGTILREQQNQRQDTPSSPQPVVQVNTPVADQASNDSSEIRVQVNDFEFSGNTLISSSELRAQLSEFEGEELTFGQLQSLGTILSSLYVERGYLARFVLPPQELEGGILYIETIEGVQGELEITGQGQRVDHERVRDFVEARVTTGQPLNLRNLGEALNILNDQPGIDVSSTLQPGGNDREIGVNVNTNDTPLLIYNVGVANHGTKAAGQGQLSLGLGINNLTSRFDLLRVNLNKTEGSTSVGLGYGLALGNRGLRLSVDGSILDYDLVQSEFKALQAEGDARTMGIELNYPLSRRSSEGSDLTLRLEQSLLEDNTVAGQTGNRTVRRINLGWSRYDTLMDGWYQGVINSNISLVLGDSKEKNAAALAADALGRNVNGSFATLNLGVSHLRPMQNNWSLTSSFSGQLSNKNLDSSARFSLGGVYGVRGYPVSEATGDEGYIASFDLMHLYQQGRSYSFFLDYGRIHLNQDPDGLVLDTPNWYSLASAGIEANMQLGQNFALNAVLAQPLGSNPGADINGRNVDGAESDTRVWFSLTSYF